MKIVFLDQGTLPVPLRAPAFSHTWVGYDATPSAQVAERLAGATLAITNKVRIDAATLAACPSLKLVAIAATGTDTVDLEACRARGVAVTNVQGYAGGAVAEHVLLLMLALRKRLPWYLAQTAEAWPQAPGFCLLGPPIGDVEGATLGLVGYGTLARSVALRATALGMKVILAERRGATPREGRLEFEAVLAAADVLSLHCPLTPETQHLIDAPALAAMKPEALLINTARGGLVDAEALVAALRSGRLGGAGIDVLDTEPPPAGHPLLRPGTPNLIVTPHVAWASQASMGRLGGQLVDALESWVAGGALNRVV